MLNVTKSNIIFVWDNFGPGHADRSEAVAERFGVDRRVIGIEISGQSSTYEWKSESRSNFRKITLFPGETAKHASSLTIFRNLTCACLRNFNSVFFFCHYERPEIFTLAIILRILGRKVIIMGDSKFDDYPRNIWRELLKYVLHLPYMAGLASGERSVDYLRFLGVNKNQIRGNYNALSLVRIRDLGGFQDADPTLEDFHKRYFIVVARLVQKKNLFTTLRAYFEYSRKNSSPRRLKILGAGPQAAELKALADDLGIQHLIDWHGFVQTDVVCRLLNGALALILLSSEEQFGNVVIEATALGIPCIVSMQVGARDHLIRSGQNGFVVEQDNAIGAAYFMQELSTNFNFWLKARQYSLELCHFGDVMHFSKAVFELIEKP